MKTLDLDELVNVTGGIVTTRRATPQQLDTFHRCLDAANRKSIFRPSTWSSPRAAECFGNLIEGVRKNPPEISV